MSQLINRHRAKAIRLHGMRASVVIALVSECPWCKTTIQPNVLQCEETDTQLKVLHSCTKCEEWFLALYTVDDCPIQLEYDSDEEWVYYPEIVLPAHTMEQKFNLTIETLSKDFVETYNQALTAQMQNLDRIAGVGFRKAVEFLIKDYAIQRYAADAPKIKSAALNQCIEDYIDNEKIKITARAAVWLGNDYAHYEKRHTTHDIEDMKRFISGCIHFIEMEKAFSDAEALVTEK